MNDRKVDLWRLVAEQRRNESLLERLNEMHRKLEKAQWHLNQAQDLVNDLRYDGQRQKLDGFVVDFRVHPVSMAILKIEQEKTFDKL